jgi:hypothetical protein
MEPQMPRYSDKWTVQDRYGNTVYMTTERWEHALESRPWLADYFKETLDTLRFGRRKQNPLRPNKYKYYWRCDDLLPEYNHIVVVVLAGERIDEKGQYVANNYVTNVWAVYIYSRE